MVLVMARRANPGAGERPYHALGRRLAEARRALGRSQRDIAQEARISPGYLPRIETGRNRPDPLVLRSLARVLNLDYDELAALAGYRSPLAGEELLAVPHRFAGVVRRLIERYTPEELTRFEQALALMFLDLRRVPQGEPQADGHDDRPEPEADVEDVRTRER